MEFYRIVEKKQNLQIYASTSINLKNKSPKNAYSIIIFLYVQNLANLILYYLRYNHVGHFFKQRNVQQKIRMVITSEGCTVLFLKLGG